MKNRTLLLPLATLIVGSGCGMLLGLGDYKDSPTTGAGGSTTTSVGATTTGTSTSTGSTTTTGTGTSSGMGGSGGNGGAGGTPESCANIGSPFDILTDLDTGAEPLDDKSLALITNQATQTAYVEAVGTTTGTVYVVAVGDKIANPIQGLQKYVPPPMQGAPHIERGGVTKMNVSFFGSLGTDIVRYDFPLMGGATQQVKIANTSCSPGQYIRNVAFGFDPNGFMQYVETTVDQNQTTATLCYGTGVNGMAGVLGTGQLGPGKQGLELIAQSIVATQSGILIRSGSDGPGDVYYAWGNSAAELAQRKVLKLSKKMVEQSAIFGQIQAKGDGVVILGATITDPTLVPATLFTGEVPYASYKDLDSSMGAIPPPELTPQIKLTKPQDIALLSRPVPNSQRIFAGGQSFTADSARVWVFNRSGGLLLANYASFVAPMGHSVLNAAVTFDGAELLLAWIEKTNDTPAKFLVRGQLLGCN